MEDNCGAGHLHHLKPPITQTHADIKVLSPSCLAPEQLKPTQLSWVAADGSRRRISLGLTTVEGSRMMRHGLVVSADVPNAERDGSPKSNVRWSFKEKRPAHRCASNDVTASRCPASKPECSGG